MKRKHKYCIIAVCLVAFVFCCGIFIGNIASAAATTVANFQTATYLSASYDGTSTTYSTSTNRLTLKATPSESEDCNGNVTYAAKTTTCTITNNTTTTANVTFTVYSITSGYTVTMNGGSYSNGGSTTVALAPGGSVTVQVTSGNVKGTITAQVTVSIAWEASTKKITIDPANMLYDESGSLVSAGTVSVKNGTTVTTVTSQDQVIEFNTAKTLTFSATAKEGFEVGAWYVDDGQTIKYYFTSTHTPTITYKNDITVIPIFRPIGAAVYKLGASYHCYLDEADSIAASGTDKTIVAVIDGKIALSPEATEAKISSGVTFLIPYDDSHTLCKEAPSLASSYSTPTVYRKVIVPSGMNLQIFGALSLSARQSRTQGSNGAPVGSCSIIEMEKDSKISIKNQATLYAWGFVAGEGEVEVASGGTVYEDFQLLDWRGGSATLDMRNNSKRVFPMSQYCVQNVQVPMTLHHGAIENVYMTVSVSSQIMGVSIPFIGTSSGMFRLASGSVTKDYDEASDRLIINMNGTATVSSLSVVLNDVPLAGTVTFDSADYTLPLDSGITINAKPGSITTISQDLAVLPGAEINIEDGAQAFLQNGSSIFLYDIDDWDSTYCFTKKITASAKYVYGRQHERGADEIGDATVCVNGYADMSAGYVYTTTGGANLCSTGKGVIELVAGTKKETFQATQSDSVAYVSVPLTPAKLKNADGNYQATSSYDGTYHYSGSIWYTHRVDYYEGANTNSATLIPSWTEYNVGGFPAQNNTLDHVAGMVVGANHGTWVDHNTTTEDDSYVKEYFRTCSAKLLVYKDEGHTNPGANYEYYLNSYFWMDASCYLGSTFDQSLLTVTANGEAAEFVVLNDGAIYVVVKVLSNELPDSLQIVLTYDGVSSDPIEVGFEEYYEMVYSSSEDKGLLDAIVDYGEASDIYFDKTGTVDAPAKPDGIDAELVGEFNKESYVTGMTMSTTGANIYFDDALRLGVRYSLSGEVPKGYTIVQMGLLVGENWNKSDKLTTSAHDRAYLIYDGLGELPANTGEVIFDLVAKQYLSEFSIRTFTVVKDAEGNTHCIYGHQYRYGLETYINRIFDNADNAFKNLLVKTWEYANAAYEAYSSEVTK